MGQTESQSIVKNGWVCVKEKMIRGSRGVKPGYWRK
jgi:hypothetical protein